MKLEKHEENMWRNESSMFSNAPISRHFQMVKLVTKSWGWSKELQEYKPLYMDLFRVMYCSLTFTSFQADIQMRVIVTPSLPAKKVEIAMKMHDVRNWQASFIFFFSFPLSQMLQLIRLRSALSVSFPSAPLCFFPVFWCSTTYSSCRIALCPCTAM